MNENLEGEAAVAALQPEAAVARRRHAAQQEKLRPGLGTADPVVVAALRALEGRTVDIESLEAWQDEQGVVVGGLYRQNFGNGVWGTLLVDLHTPAGEFLHGQPVWMIVRVTPAGEE